jgi:hypothetical protein
MPDRLRLSYPTDHPRKSLIFGLDLSFHLHKARRPLPFRPMRTCDEGFC